jgi:hypothetical protein
VAGVGNSLLIPSKLRAKLPDLSQFRHNFIAIYSHENDVVI